MGYSGRGQGLERFVRGDVVLLDFPFSDVNVTKRRPALILQVLGRNCILAQITSVVRYLDVEVMLSAKDFCDGGLSRTSVVRVDHLFTSDPVLFIDCIGRVHDKKLCEVIDVTCAMLRGEA